MPKFPSGYTAKTTPVDNDKVLIADSAASDAIKSVTIVNLVKNRIVAVLQTVVAWITTAMITDAAVTDAKWRNGILFHAYRTTNFTHSTVATKMALNAELYDVAANFDTTLYRFTAPVNGYYRFTGGVGLVLNVTQGKVMALYKNGTTIATLINHQYSSAGGWTTAEVGSVTVPLLAGDYVELFELAVPAVTGTANTTFLQGELVTRS